MFIVFFLSSHTSLDPSNAQRLPCLSGSLVNNQPAISDKSFFFTSSKKRNARDEMKSVYYDYAQQPTWAICHSPIDSYENRKLVFLIHKSIFVYAAHSQFGPTSASFCY